MFCSVMSTAISGVEALPVSVEADVSRGMPHFAMVGYVSSQVREAQDRVRTAIHNLGLTLPPSHITINLAPGDLRKDGTRFDLPIAAAVLEAMGQLRPEALAGSMLIGELHLDGTVQAVTGVLPSVLSARERGCQRCLVPAENETEARAVKGMEVIGLRSLRDLLDYSCGSYPPDTGHTPVEAAAVHKRHQPDFCEIRGQAAVKRAALLAAAGFHNLLLSGPPGSGKSMTAERLPSILPDMTEEEQMEISKIYSIVGLLPKGTALLGARPFRAPHHTITASALCGGGYTPRPGEVTLAHRGVLFLDELPEMDGGTLEMLRQPLEDRRITVSRIGGTCVFPASFLLVAAMNPCPCGYYPDRNRCRCSDREVAAYQAKISQALLDRIDLRCDVPPATYEDLRCDLSAAKETSSAALRAQVCRAVAVQQARYLHTDIHFNSELRAPDIATYCPMTDEAARLMESAFAHLGLSARGYHHVLKVARTIADLDKAERLCEAHIAEALCYRSPDGKPA